MKRNDKNNIVELAPQIINRQYVNSSTAVRTVASFLYDACFCRRPVDPGALVATTTSSVWWNDEDEVVLVRAGRSRTLSKMRGPTRRGAVQKFLHGARRVEDNNNDNGEDNTEDNNNNYYEPDEEGTFLRNYSIHVLSCLDGEMVRNTVNDEEDDEDENHPGRVV